MERMSTSSTSLIWQLAITPHNAVANGTFGLSLHRALDIAFESCERVNQAPVEDSDST